jgi:hypothetical protein
VIAMNQALRWTLVLGCLLLAILEAPHSSLVLLQDLRGPWRAESQGVARPAAAPIAVVSVEARPSDAPLAARSASFIPSRALHPEGAFASLAPEELLGIDCIPTDRSASEQRPGRHQPSFGRVALLFAR